MTIKVPTKDVVKAAGGNRALSKRFGIASEAVSGWIKKDAIPPRRVSVVSRMSGVPAHMIRPDLPDLFPAPTQAGAA